MPLALAQLGQMLLGAVDTAVLGRYGELELGASGLGNSVYFTFALFGMGVMQGLDPLVSQALGAGEAERARYTLWQGLWLALAMTVPVTVLIVATGGLLELLGIEPATADQARVYVYSRLPGLLPFFVFAALRSYLQARHVTRPLIVGMVLANILNVPLSWLLVFGDSGLRRFGLPACGVPELGVVGAGLTSTVCTVLQMAVLLVALRRLDSGAEPSRRPERRVIARAFSLGLPIGFAILAEVGVFSATNFAMGNLGKQELAAHQVALTLSALTFMIPMGVGAATSVRVGHAVGRGDTAGARRSGLLGLCLGGGFMALGSVAFVLAPESLSRLITDQESAISAAVPLVFIAAVFQLSDGIQAVAAGALRGAGDTRVTMLANVFGHYLVGLPLGLGLCFVLGWGAQGLWWGLSAGLTAVAIALMARFLVLTRRELERV